MAAPNERPFPEVTRRLFVFSFRKYPRATPTLVDPEGMQQQFMFWSIIKVQNMMRCNTPSRGR
ncbi:hypothetical protein A6R68_00721 [Neotoma lepida]|uniref:Uncharacterized protein n=1 Tax=Neotoma lepida TaxID=56216 RepID=A0A1A6GZF1_NEOLE|nr:hypothetical protein A6R68_00721 [Neotoma lepida]